MVSSSISGVRISTVVPGKARGENEHYALTNTDLAVKLHYIRGVYFFQANDIDRDRDHHHHHRTAADGSPLIQEIKKPMFELLDRYFVTAGRVRRSDGRDYIKCNDAGVRIVEAFCEKTVDEWLSNNNHNNNNMDELGFDDQGDCHGGLCYDQVLGPDLAFSPLVYIQFTLFKCGGLSMGLSWAHLLGDVVSAMGFINTWAQLMAGHVPQESIHVPSCKKVQEDSFGFVPKKALSLKESESVGNHWLLTANNCQKMITHSFKVTPKQLELLISNTCGKKVYNFSGFEILSAVIWKSLARIRKKLCPKAVTICCYEHSYSNQNSIPNNKCMELSTVEADLGFDVSALAFRIANKKTDESDAISEIVGKDNENVDYFVYGGNLTFVNLEKIDIYGLELKGQRPIFANYTLSGVGDEGLVLVLPLGPKDGEDANGRMLTLVLPEDQLVQLKNELNEYWSVI